jgi:hypothetical protein
MKSRLFVLFLCVAMLLCVTVAASAADIPNWKQLDLERPEIPSMTCKNDGATQTVTLSEPIDWMAGIWNWNWVNADFTDDSHTAATLDQNSQDAENKCQQGYGTYSGVWYNEDGEVGGHYAGTYEMDYAYDVAAKNGVNVKYDNFGRPVYETVTTQGTEYFGNGPSEKTTIVYRYGQNSVGGHEFFVDEITEEYPDGSRIHARFAMSGEANYVYQIGADETHTVLYVMPVAPAEEPEVKEHCVNWWIAYDTPDDQIEVPENGYIKIIEGEIVHHVQVGEDIAVYTDDEFDESLIPSGGWEWVDGDGNHHVQTAKDVGTHLEAEHDDSLIPEYGWEWVENTSYKQVWVIDD